MAKDIWKRKPEKMLSTEARSWLAELQEEWNVLQEKAEKLEAIKKAFINYFGGIDTDVINNEDFEAAQFDPCDSYYFANATRKILVVEEGPE